MWQLLTEKAEKPCKLTTGFVFIYMSLSDRNVFCQVATIKISLRACCEVLFLSIGLMGCWVASRKRYLPSLFPFHHEEGKVI